MRGPRRRRVRPSSAFLPFSHDNKTVGSDGRYGQMLPGICVFGHLLSGAMAMSSPESRPPGTSACAILQMGFVLLSQSPADRTPYLSLIARDPIPYLIDYCKSTIITSFAAARSSCSFHHTFCDIERLRFRNPLTHNPPAITFPTNLRDWSCSGNISAHNSQN